MFYPPHCSWTNVINFNPSPIQQHCSMFFVDFDVRSTVTHVTHQNCLYDVDQREVCFIRKWSFQDQVRKEQEVTSGKWGQGNTVISVSIACSAFSLGAGKSGWQLGVIDSAMQPSGSFCASWASVWRQISLHYLPGRVTSPVISFD